MRRSDLIRALPVLAALLSMLTACDPSPCEVLSPGDYECGLGDRSYLLHVPNSYTAQEPVPLVLDMHGWLTDANGQRAKSGWLAKSDQEGFIAVWPQGNGNSWNAQGACCDFLNIQNDVGFLEDLIAALQEAGSIDAGRVYATGHSNGGSMAHTLACESADRIGGAAPVSYPLSGGSYGQIVSSCNPALGVPVIHFHGTSDFTVGYDGFSFTLDTLSAPDSLAAWAEIQSCGPILDSVSLGNTLCESYSGCIDGVGVTLCTVFGGEHELYGDLSAATIADQAWAFWESFPLIVRASAPRERCFNTASELRSPAR